MIQCQLYIIEKERRGRGRERGEREHEKEEGGRGGRESMRKKREGEGEREMEKRKEVRMRKGGGGGGKSVRKEGGRKTEKVHSHKCTNQIYTCTYTTIQKCIKNDVCTCTSFALPLQPSSTYLLLWTAQSRDRD